MLAFYFLSFRLLCTVTKEKVLAFYFLSLGATFPDSHPQTRRALKYREGLKT